MCSTITLQLLGKDRGKSSYLLLMAIILDVQYHKGDAYQRYLEKTLFGALAKALPTEKFIAPNNEDYGLNSLKNVTTTTFPPTQGLFLKMKNDKWLRAQNASVFISFTRTLKTSIPLKQVLLISTHNPKIQEKDWSRAEAIGLTTVSLKTEFSTQLPTLASRIFLAEGFVTGPEILPDDVQQQHIKERFTEGLEFFIATDFDWSKEKLILLLKSFSRLKKMQQSSWKLMIVVRFGDETIMNMALELISTYKYRADVVITDDEQLYEKIAAAYALVSVDKEEKFPVVVEEAFQVNTPAIALPTQALKDMYGDIVVYPLDSNHDAIGDMLMLMYKGETYRQSLAKRIAGRKNSYGEESFIKALKQVLTNT